MAYVYIIGTKECGPLKIGITDHLAARLSALQTGRHDKLYIFDFYEMERDSASRIEKRTHILLSHVRMEGEWFDISLIHAQHALCAAMGNDIIRQADAPEQTFIHFLFSCRNLDGEYANVARTAFAILNDPHFTYEDTSFLGISKHLSSIEKISGHKMDKESDGLNKAWEIYRAKYPNANLPEVFYIFVDAFYKRHPRATKS